MAEARRPARVPVPARRPRARARAAWEGKGHGRGAESPRPGQGAPARCPRAGAEGAESGGLRLSGADCSLAPGSRRGV